MTEDVKPVWATPEPDGFPIGKIALQALSVHYRTEVVPYLNGRDIAPAQIRAAAHRALDRVLDEVWPNDR